MAPGYRFQSSVYNELGILAGRMPGTVLSNIEKLRILTVPSDSGDIWFCVCPGARGLSFAHH